MCGRKVRRRHGKPLIFASSTAVLFGLYEQVSTWGSIAAIPVFAWEMSLAVWLIAKGFKPLATTAGSNPHHKLAPQPA